MLQIKVLRRLSMEEFQAAVNLAIEDLEKDKKATIRQIDPLDDENGYSVVITYEI